MQTLKLFQKLSFTTQLALISFLIGTILFLLYFLIPKNESILFLGLFYVFAASFLNGIAFLALIFHLINNKKNREETLIKILIILANIPIAIAYFFILINSFK